jgi:histidine triad (HIT) family protein
MHWTSRRVPKSRTIAAMDNCIFCRIVRKELGGPWLAENEHAIAFADLHPQAPVHVLVIPKLHIQGVHALTQTDAAVAGAVLLLAREVAAQKGLGESGYRLVTNEGQDGGQSVFHWHVHVLGGRMMQWPPG